MNVQTPLARAGVLSVWALVTLFLARPGGILGKSARDSTDYAETVIPIFDPSVINRLVDQMKRDAENIALPPGYVYWKDIIAKVTAYEPSELSCPGTADGKTSLGDNAWHLDGVAADPVAIPYRTVVWIPEVGLREVDDTGSAMRRAWKEAGVYHLDLRMTYPHEARRWGVKLLPVRLYRLASTPGEAVAGKESVPR